MLLRAVAIGHDRLRSDANIAATLNRMGMPTGQRKTWTADGVSSVRRVNGIHAYRSAEND
jgi:hypothetical protein